MVVTRCSILLLAAALLSPAQTLFEFHNGFWINLHQFLLEQATASKPVESASPEWRDAVDYYRREMVKRDLLSDEAAALNNRLSTAGSRAELPAPLCSRAWPSPEGAGPRSRITRR